MSVSERSKPSIFWFLAAIVLPIMNPSIKFRFENAEYLPKTGPFVLCPNHYSEIDPIVMGMATWKNGRVPRFMAKASLWKVPVVKWILNASGQIPVEREGGERGSSPVKAASILIDNGTGVIVYPEGSLTRDPDMWPMRGKKGALRVAAAGNIPIIPVAHWGTDALMPRYGKKIRLFRRVPITVRFGEPTSAEELTGGDTSTKGMTAGTDALMHRISALLGEIRGETPPAELWNPAAHGQKQTGRF